MIKIILAFAIGGALWRLGGSGKWLGKVPRRYFLPLLITLYAISKKRKWKTGLLLPTLISSFSLGYGEKHPYWFKFLVGWTWVLPRFIFLGFSWLALTVPFIWIGLFWLSNHKPYSNVFKWHIVEVIIGGLTAVSYVT